MALTSFLLMVFKRITSILRSKADYGPSIMPQKYPKLYEIRVSLVIVSLIQHLSIAPELAPKSREKLLRQ
jgi:hypothetical protein